MPKPTRVKVFVLGTRGFPGVQGGIERHCQHLYPRLAAMGFDIIIGTRSPYCSPSMPPSWKGVSFCRLWCPKTKALETIVHTVLGVFVAARQGADVLHIHAIGPSLAVPLAKLLGFKVVMTHHGQDYRRDKWGNVGKIILRLGEALGCWFADQIITVSCGIRDHVRAKFRRHAHAIPNGAEPVPFVRETTYTSSLGLTAGNYVLAVARFVPEKGLHTLLAAFSQLETNWKLVIVGDADHETSYSRQLKQEAASQDNVVMTGVIHGQSLCELYSHAGLFVLPSSHEGLPLVLLEALSLGVSVVASDIEGNRELGLDAERHFPPEDTEALARKLEDFLARPTPSAEQRARQAQRICDRYSWDSVAAQVAAVYNQVLGRCL